MLTIMFRDDTMGQENYIKISYSDLQEKMQEVKNHYWYEIYLDDVTSDTMYYSMVDR